MEETGGEGGGEIMVVVDEAQGQADITQRLAMISQSEL